MPQLSPAAQEIMNAVTDVSWDWEKMTQASPNVIAAAAILAVADQVVPDEPHPELSQFWDDEADREWQNNQHFRCRLLAIAAELEAV